MKIFAVCWKMIRNELLKRPKQEARHIIDNANKDVERVIREIKESKASKERTKAARDKLDEKKTSLRSKTGFKAR